MTKKTKTIIILLVIIAAAAAIICIWALNRQAPAEQSKGPVERVSGSSAFLDPNAENWSIDVPEEMAEEVAAAAEGNELLIPGYSWAEMKEGDLTLSLSVGNPEENTCYLKAALIVETEEGDQILYESGLFEPGKGVKELTLTQTLPAGTYDARVLFQGYTMDDEKKELNSADSAFKLYVAKQE